MANEIKTDGFYIFDQFTRLDKGKKNLLGKRFRQFLQSRYAVLALIFCWPEP